MTNVQLTLIFSKYLVQFRFSFSIISQIQPFSDVKGLVKRLDRICKFGQPDNEKGREAYFYLE